MATLKVGSLGEYIRDQRRSAQYSLRQLAEVAGVSNPYLSQIERGLKKPSAEILQQIAKALRISAETLYVHAGILEERDTGSGVVTAILGDATIGERHKRVLLDIYESFRREHDQEPREPEPGATHNPAGPERAARATASPRKSTSARSTSKTTSTSTRRKNA